MSRIARVTIDGDALQHNLSRVREFSPQSKIMAVIKANAYGHGLIYCAEQLHDADAFAVAMLDEAIALRTAGVKKPVIVLQGFLDAMQLQAMIEHDLQTVIHQSWQVDILEACTSTSDIDVWLKIDTGMHRLGVNIETVDDIMSRLNKADCVGNIFLMSHLAFADEPANAANNNQITNFINVTSNYSSARSIANSAALIALEKSRMEWVRPGIMLYGSSPVREQSAESFGLKPVMNFESTLIAVNHHKKGDPVGYGGTWQCPENMPVGVIAVGYGDGYPRHATSGTPVMIKDELCKLIGRVSMDSICVDLRGITAHVGDKVQLWGAHLSVDKVADAAGTISYELLCNVGRN